MHFAVAELSIYVEMLLYIQAAEPTRAKKARKVITQFNVHAKFNNSCICWANLFALLKVKWVPFIFIVCLNEVEMMVLGAFYEIYG